MESCKISQRYEGHTVGGGDGPEARCRLRALGYRGLFEIVASEHTLPKLAALLRSLGPNETAPKVLSPAEAAAWPRRVGVVGAWGDTPLVLGVRSCLMLQPLQWPGNRAVIDPFGSHPLRVSKYAAFCYDAVTAADLPGLIKGIMPGPSGASLLQLVRKVRRGQVDLMMIYGLHHLIRPKRTAQAFVDALHATGQKTVCLIVDAYQSYPNARRLDDVAGVAQDLAPQGPTVVALGCKELHEPIFRSLYGLSTLPPVLEGANTTNLMRLLGRPYMSVRTQTTPYPKLWGHTRARQACEDLTAMLNGRTPLQKSALQAFFNASRQSGSSLCRYFSALQDRVQAPEADQVAQGLIALHASLCRS